MGRGGESTDEGLRDAVCWEGGGVKDRTVRVMVQRLFDAAPHHRHTQQHNRGARKMNETNETKRASERARLYSSGRLIYDLRSSMIVAHLVHSSLTFDTDIAGGHRENEGGDTLSTHAIETRWRANEQANQRRRSNRV